MNEVLSAIKTRRSFRSFEQRQITDAELDAVIEAGRFAASAAGRQGTMFVAVTNAETVKKLSALNASIMGKDTDPYYGAPAVVIVFADTSHGTQTEDGSAALQNMLLAADSLGLGSCWIHRERQMFETGEGKAYKKEWGVPEEYAGVAACILGYPACPRAEAAPRKDGKVIYVK